MLYGSANNLLPIIYRSMKETAGKNNLKISHIYLKYIYPVCAASGTLFKFSIVRQSLLLSLIYSFHDCEFNYSRSMRT